MTYAPDTIKEAQRYLHEQTGLDWASLGIVGDSNHYGGYHCGRDRVVKGDYSVTESSRDSDGLTNAAAALDIGNFDRLQDFSKWLVEQCKASAEGTEGIREIIYSPDGNTVKRWDRLKIRSSGDNSHLWHTHISWFRDTENQSKVELFKRYFEDSDNNEPPRDEKPAPPLPPAPKPRYSYPLPDSYYFGWAHWGNESISGWYGTKFKGVYSKTWLKRFGRQLVKRGWPVGKGRSYLTQYGNDGMYGDEWAKLIRHFQQDQNLKVDGLAGPNTWYAAFNNPIT